MNRLFAITLQITALFWASGERALAYWPADAAEVTYKVTNDEGIDTIKKICDGHGRIRIETSGTAGKTIQIEDASKKKSLYLDEKTKTGAWQLLKPEQREQGAFAKAKTGRKLKDSVIAGHKCQGFEERTSTPLAGGPSSVDQVWFDSETGCPVLIQRTISVEGKTLGSLTQTMTSYQKKTASPALFEAPAGYKLTGTP